MSESRTFALTMLSDSPCPPFRLVSLRCNYLKQRNATLCLGRWKTRSPWWLRRLNPIHLSARPWPLVGLFCFCIPENAERSPTVSHSHNFVGISRGSPRTFDDAEISSCCPEMKGINHPIGGLVVTYIEKGTHLIYFIRFDVYRQS